MGVTLAPLLCAVAISCGIALTLPYKYQWFAATKPIVETYRGWVLIALVLSVVYLTIMTIARTAKWIGRKVWRWRFQRNLGKRLARLTVHEKHILQSYLARGTRTLEWDFSIRSSIRSLLTGFSFQPPVPATCSTTRTMFKTMFGTTSKTIAKWWQRRRIHDRRPTHSRGCSNEVQPCKPCRYPRAFFARISG